MIIDTIHLVLAAALILAILVIRPKTIPKKYINNENLENKVFIITGANSGIGYQCSLQLAKQKATIIMACRSASRTLPALEKIKSESKNDKVYFMELDCASLRSVMKFSQEFKSKFNRLDVLLLNAGLCLENRIETEDGFESTFQVNYLSQFLLSHLLIDLLKKTSKSRIVIVSSSASHFQSKINWEDLQTKIGYREIKSYSLSKLAQAMFAQELAKRIEKFGVKAVSLHPGVIDTGIADKAMVKLYRRVIWAFLSPMRWLFWKKPEDGTNNVLYCSLSNFDDLKTGKYYDNLSVAQPCKLVEDGNNKKLWEISVDLLRSKNIPFEEIL